jgi:hypothetical protein
MWSLTSSSWTLALWDPSTICVSKIRVRQDEEYTSVIIYVDDGLAWRYRPQVLNEILDFLSQYFKIRSIPLTRFVGLDITRKRKNRTLSIKQTDFIRHLLTRYNMAECHSVVTKKKSK